MKLFDTTYRGLKFLLILGIVGLIFFTIKTCEDVKDKADDAKDTVKATAKQLEERSKRLENRVSEIADDVVESIEDSRRVIDAVSGSGETTEGTGLEYIGGDVQVGCAAQGHDCGADLYCPDNQWIQSRNSVTCCLSVCVDRIQSSYMDEDLGRVTVEKLSHAYVVWYGSSLSFANTGAPNSAEALQVYENVWRFALPSGQYFFRVVEEDDAIFEVGAVG